MKFFLSILARFFLCLSIFIFLGGMINSMLGTALRFRMKESPIELPTDFLTTAVATLIPLLAAGGFWFLQDIPSAVKKMKGNIRVTVAIVGGAVIAIIFIVMTLPKLASS